MRDGETLVLTGQTGKQYTCVWSSNPKAGAMKEVFFPADRAYAVALFKEGQEPDKNKMARLDALVNTYRAQLFEGPNPVANEYWRRIFCWPYDIVSGGGRIGIVMPLYPGNFFFRTGHTIIQKGQEKMSGWFTDPYHRYCHVPPAEAGDWKNTFEVSLLLARGIRKMHAMGLAHSDLSYKNVLVDPAGRSAYIIDIDGLVVPGKFDAEVEGTPEYIAPEVVASRGEAKRYTPSKETDKHALAVLIYQLLLGRHPLKGKKRFEDDDSDSRELGRDALFIENPLNPAARYDASWVKSGTQAKKLPYLFPWLDLDKVPYTVLGPYLSDLVERAFVTALRPPQVRPTAAEWESALERTIELLHPCENPKCVAKWFVFDGESKPVCPFCGTKVSHPIPVMKFVQTNRDGTEGYESMSVASLQNSRKLVQRRVVLWDNGKLGSSWLFPCHAHANLPPRENRTKAQNQGMAKIVGVQNRMGLYNIASNNMFVSLKGGKPQRLEKGKGVALVNGLRVQLDGLGSRVLEIEMR